MRVVSLLPSATELCYALGVEPVGVSHECDHPPRAREQPTVVHSRVDASASSQEINDQVEQAVESGGVYRLDRDLLGELDPDVVLSQGVCEVCAVDDTAVRQAVEGLALDATIVATDPHSLGDLFDDLERIGRVLGRERRARELRREWHERVEAVARATPETGPRVAVLDWMDPVMVAGHWIPGMVERAGATYGLADPGERSRPREWATIREYDPEVLVAAPCGFDLDQTRANIGDLTDRPGWDDLTAVQTGQVYAMDGNRYVNRPGPRLVDTLELLADVVHPDVGTMPDGASDAVRRLPVTEPPA